MVNQGNEAGGSKGGLYGEREERPPVVAEPQRAHGRRAARGGRRRRLSAWKRRTLWFAAFLGVAYAALALWMIVSRMYGRSVRDVPPEEPPATAAVVPPAAAGFPDAAAVRALVSGESDVRSVLGLSGQLAARGLKPEAIAKLRDQLKATPENLALRGALARQLADTGQFREAATLLVAMLRTDPAVPGARVALATVLLGAGEAEAAYEVAKWGLASAPGNPDLLKAAARACFQANWNEVAVTHLRQLMDRRHDDIEARQLLSVAYLRLGHYGKSIAHLLELVKAREDEPLNYYNLAVCYAQQGQVEETVNVLSRAANRVDPEVVVGWLGGEDFKPVGDQRLFATFRDQIMQRTRSSMLQVVSATDRAAKTGPGLLPEPNFDLRPPDSGLFR